MSKGIDLKGSTRTISEFFEYSINSILYQRGIYPAEDFTTVKKYDLTLMRTHDDELKQYIRKILSQVHKWLLSGKCNKLVLCVVDRDEGDTVERWAFNVTHISKEPQESITEEVTPISQEETQKQIRALIRQITASVTFLPELENEGNYTFNVLAYTDADAIVPLEWSDSSSKEIEDGEMVEFRSFNTEMHKIGAQVSYKYQQ
ncbi:hypothetical protein TPHA_0N00970 [Tetrapisispora phaffii CBS 4417]|uniref:HORMA domain-containing protein n=1 Tax=Tetrapisispora phaffii (strain ATCC 24235 / CBS 4417 / NBRC 1672 / NRRL Y-8282 / UCD 70-5) TaxID=1071381 RepID=G8C150_TETPH|nr:hypothetical protein TPHA_0N00970 [Tetrapisispora phaffii CBS 4417]CCE65878.1 hypothetical protein TPHA_0N00970 [Tetrapisispora phaffii CBS 4417]